MSGATNAWTARCATNGRAFARLVKRARRLAAEPGGAEPALRMAELAAELAWRRHAGVFASAPLEALIAELAPAVPEAGDPPTSPGTVHVLTEAWETGGHTRLAERWIEASEDERHSVVVTQQPAADLPDRLRTAVSASGGRCHSLPDAHRSLLARAGALRSIVRAADRVVLYVHPSDAVAMLGLAANDARVPVLLANHADHVFWLGPSWVDVVLSIRDVAAQVVTERRGVEPRRSLVLPLPIDVRASTSREVARARLGVGANETLLITVSSAYKFESSPEEHMAPVLAELASRHRGVRTLVVGPEPVGPWASAAERSGGRVAALGVRLDLPLLYAAADIYLESFPVGSMTTMLEAAAAGLPVVGLRSRLATQPLLSSVDPSTDAFVLRAADGPAYLALLAEMIEDPVARARAARRAQDVVAGQHVGTAWQARRDRALALVDELAGEPPHPRAVHAAPDALDADVCRFLLTSGVSETFHSWSLPRALRGLNRREAARAWAICARGAPSGTWARRRATAGAVLGRREAGR